MANFSADEIFLDIGYHISVNDMSQYHASGWKHSVFLFIVFHLQQEENKSFPLMTTKGNKKRKVLSNHGNYFCSFRMELLQFCR